DVEGAKVGIRAPAHKTSPQICSPSLPQITEERCCRMFGAPEHGISRVIQGAAKIRQGAERSLQILGRGIGIGSVQRQLLPSPALQLDFCAVGERLLHIEKLAQRSEER